MTEQTQSVVFSRAADYSYEAVGAAVKRQFELLRVAEGVKSGTKVTIKPNLLMRRAPERFTTTHPMLVRCVAERLMALGAVVTIADSPGGPYTAVALGSVYKGCGMEAAARESGAVLNLNTAYSARACASFRACSGFNIIEPITGADMVFNLPKLKTHGMTVFSGGVKNLFGCVPGLQKPELHCRFQDRERFCEMLLDLAVTVSPAFTIIDGVVSMEGDGPSSGTARRTGFLAGSRSPYALDEAVCEAIQLKNVPTVRLARERGMLVGEIARLGDLPHTIRPFVPPRGAAVNFGGRLPKILHPAASWITEKLGRPEPKIISRRCVGCKKCIESCPKKIIELLDGKAKIKPAGCIHCYCCHEMCPVGAVALRRFGL